MTDISIIISIILIILAIILIYNSRKIHKKAISKKKQFRIPEGKITYSDLNLPSKPLFSRRYRITGKPDYIVKKNNQYIPIEVKSGSNQQPHKNHILQLATYCQLIEENYGNFVPYGIIVYSNSDFKIPFNPSLRFELESVIKKMRSVLKNKIVVLNHEDPSKCRYCSMRIYCNKKLV